jgi:flagellar biosynthesis protein FlhF
MKVKTFHAITMQDAMRMIKEELGPEAIILSSKEVREGGRILRLFNRPVLEVMAACEQDAPRREETPEPGAPATSAGSAAPSPAARSFHATLQSALESATADAKPAVPLKRAGREQWRLNRLRHLRAELRELSRLLAESLPPETQSMGAQVSRPLTLLCRSFVQQGMRPSTAEALGSDLQQRLGGGVACDDETVGQALRQEIARRIRVSGPLLGGGGGRTVCLILGPSGAGKTSIVTKLAAQYRIELKRSVAVVTFDSCCEASVELLRRYARTLGVPFASARSPRQLYEGLRRHARADLVLIDMPGVGPEDVSAAEELHRHLAEEMDVTAHVVLPASARERDLCRIVERVKGLPSLRLLFTKLDETESFGTIFDLAYQTGLPLSYWGVGQRVPEDIETASPERLADLLMAQRYVVSRRPEFLTPVPQRAVPMPEPVGAVSELNEWLEELSCKTQ